MSQMESPCRPAALRLGADQKPLRITQALGRIWGGMVPELRPGFKLPRSCFHFYASVFWLQIPMTSVVGFQGVASMAFASSYRLSAVHMPTVQVLAEGRPRTLILHHHVPLACLRRRLSQLEAGSKTHTQWNHPLHPAFAGRGCFCSPHPCAVGISWRSNAARVHNAPPPHPTPSQAAASLGRLADGAATWPASIASVCCGVFYGNFY
jgi:hypothetical protein